MTFISCSLTFRSIKLCAIDLNKCNKEIHKVDAAQFI